MTQTSASARSHRPRAFTVLGAAFVAGAAAAFGVNSVLDAHLAQVQPRVESEPILVAIRSLQAGAPVTVWDVALKDWPKAMVPASAMRLGDDLDNLVVRHPLREGQPILAVQLARSGSVGELEVRPMAVAAATTAVAHQPERDLWDPAAPPARPAVVAPAAAMATTPTTTGTTAPGTATPATTTTAAASTVGVPSALPAASTATPTPTPIETAASDVAATPRETGVGPAVAATTPDSLSIPAPPATTETSPKATAPSPTVAAFPEATRDVTAVPTTGQVTTNQVTTSEETTSEANAPEAEPVARVAARPSATGSRRPMTSTIQSRAVPVRAALAAQPTPADETTTDSNATATGNDESPRRLDEGGEAAVRRPTNTVANQTSAAGNGSPRPQQANARATQSRSAPKSGQPQSGNRTGSRPSGFSRGYRPN